MKITPRAPEVKAVVDLLEDESFEDATALAKAIIKTVCAFLSDRDMAAVAWRTGPGAPVIAWGPFMSPADAKKFAESLSVGGEGLGVTLYSPTALEGRTEEAGTPRVGVCKQCGHPWGTHLHEKRAGCQLKGCKCSNLVK